MCDKQGFDFGQRKRSDCVYCKNYFGIKGDILNLNNYEQGGFEEYARAVSELFEQDSRRFNRALPEEEEAKI